MEKPLNFWKIQAISVCYMVAGWFLLIIPCMFKLWKPVIQIYIPDWQKEAGIPAKMIYLWKWEKLNPVYGNDEDGVVGAFNPNGSRWKAYIWSAWRNNTNNLRFKYRWIGGPFYRKEWRGWYFQYGWYDNGFPVISAGRI